MATLPGTTRLIMNVFSKNWILKHHYVSLFDLFYDKSHWQKCHQDNLAKAIQELVKQGLIKWGEAYALVLTEEGFNALSRPD